MCTWSRLSLLSIDAKVLCLLRADSPAIWTVRLLSLPFTLLARTVTLGQLESELSTSRLITHQTVLLAHERFSRRRDLLRQRCCLVPLLLGSSLLKPSSLTLPLLLSSRLTFPHRLAQVTGEKRRFVNESRWVVSLPVELAFSVSSAS